MPRKISKPEVAEPALSGPRSGPVEGPSGLLAPAGIWCWLAYLASVAAPSAGLALGLVYVSQKDPATKRFAYTCFVLAAIGWAAGSLGGWLDGLDPDKYTENYY
jgi:hypothetical protein